MQGPRTTQTGTSGLLHGQEPAVPWQTSTTEGAGTFVGGTSPTFDLEVGPATSLTLPLVGAGDLRTLFAR